MKDRIYIWELPVRLFHWVHVASMVVLAVTGYYIGDPFIVVSSEPARTYLMGWMRGIHFVSAWALAMGVLVRFYWLFVGGQYASWRDWIPVSRERRAFLWQQFKYYIFLTRERPDYLGHNPQAGLSYAVLGALILVQGLSGFALYAEPYTSGFWRVAFGWLLTLFANQTLRLVHHALMWVFGVFTIIHIYMSVLEEVEEREFSISAMIGGFKFDPKGE